MNKIMILSDGETFAGLDGCMEAEVLWDETKDGFLTPEEFDAKVEEYEAESDDIWAELEYGIIAKVYKVYKQD